MCRYVQYETKLEELRRLRKESRVLKGKKGLSESAIIRRIHFIYERATRKFRGDLRLWSAWLEFCKESNSKRRLSQVTTMHPKPDQLEGSPHPATVRRVIIRCPPRRRSEACEQRPE